MKLIYKFLCLLFVLPAYASDAFDQVEIILTSASLSDSLNPWETDLKAAEWRVILENCYDRNVDSNAKQALIKLLESNGQIKSDMSSRDINLHLVLYCSHALSLAEELGIKIQLIPLDPSNAKVINRSSLIESCYAFRKKGFTTSFRGYLELFIATEREVSGMNKQDPATLPDVLLAYSGMCGAIFANETEVPIHAKFITK